jgi:hypothetical protein
MRHRDDTGDDKHNVTTTVTSAQGSRGQLNSRRNARKSEGCCGTRAKQHIFFPQSAGYEQILAAMKCDSRNNKICTRTGMVRGSIPYLAGSHVVLLLTCCAILCSAERSGSSIGSSESVMVRSEDLTATIGTGRGDDETRTGSDSWSHSENESGSASDSETASGSASWTLREGEKRASRSL